MNPLLEKFNSPYGAIPFSLINPEHFLPALKHELKRVEDYTDKIKTMEDPDFEQTIEFFESESARLDVIVNIFYGLHSAECSDEISAISEEFSNLLTKHNSKMTLDPEVFNLYSKLYKKKEQLNLSKEQKMILEDTYSSFVRNGALLDESDKERLKIIDEELSALGIAFGENVRKATSEYTLFVDDRNRLKGLPEDSIEQAATLAASKGKDSHYAFNLQFPSFYPLLQYCEDRKLREEISNANSQKAVNGKFSNQENVLNILKLRNERAKLLGYKTHAHFVLEKRMAKSPEKVTEFLDGFLKKSKSKAKEEFEKLKVFSGLSDFSRHDFAFYSEKLKKKEIEIDDELLKPYFKLENVINGIFTLANKLYDLNFKELDNVDRYHEEVKVFEVTDVQNDFVGLFYADYFPRDSKRPGAWMTNLRSQGLQFGKVERPFIMNVCNFTKPTKNKPSLLTLNEVLTLFHEFGHGLHGLLSKCRYMAKSGTNVMWDFVELPSQILENWALEKEVLELFAFHYETGDLIPEELVNKIKNSQKFMQGLATLRQTSFALLDLSLHTMDPEKISSIIETENVLLKDLDLFERSEKQSMSCSFGHLFSGGYSAGYYSYKWAEVLDADAFEAFKENGIFDKRTATLFKENILEKGGTCDPELLYKNFRGKMPSIEPLLNRSGLN